MDLLLEINTPESSRGTGNSWTSKSQFKVCSVTKLAIAASDFTPCEPTLPSDIDVSSMTRSVPAASCSWPATRRFASKSFRGRHFRSFSAWLFSSSCTTRGTSCAAAWLKSTVFASCGQRAKFSDQQPRDLSPCLANDLEAKSMSTYSAATLSPPRPCASCATAAARAAATAPGAANCLLYAAASRASESQLGVNGNNGW
mmetsp:Transcript_122737/g.354783  ORF Transcript_122737/g.354783 Transcript_122737/m.354783 type:complete len:200 (-) Transcript_122737:949-1548(-)